MIKYLIILNSDLKRFYKGYFYNVGTLFRQLSIYDVPVSCSCDTYSDYIVSHNINKIHKKRLQR